MLAQSVPIVSDAWQYLLDGVGWVLARIYDVIPNYGLSIIVLTIIIRFLLFPLGMKQIKSMQHMQALQPKIKEIQRKYKTNKQKAQEETMKLYKEAGVNPLGGCLPVLAQFPILIAMYHVLRAPGLEAVTYQDRPAYEVVENHLPVNSALFADTISHERTGLLLVNLQCSALEAGSAKQLKDKQGQPVQAGDPLLNDDGTPLEGTNGQPLISQSSLDCGDDVTDKIAYFFLLAIMIGTTFFQQRQMQRASPPGAASAQQQAIMRIMPLFFGFIGVSFPAGLVLYWTTSNVFQLGQQTLLLRAGHIGPDAIEKRMAEQRAKQAAQTDEPKRKGFFLSMMERADQERQRRDGEGPKPKPKGTASKGTTSKAKGTGSKSGSSKAKPTAKKGTGSRPKGSGKGTPRTASKQNPKGSSRSNPRKDPSTGRKEPGSEGNGGT